MADDRDVAHTPTQQNTERDTKEARSGSANLTIIIDDEVSEAARCLPQPLLARIAQTTLELAGIRQAVEVTLLVRDDAGLRELNRVYRGKDEVTDVLSFPLLDEPLVEAPAEELWQEVTRPAVPFITAPDVALHLGDIAISYPTVVRQAGTAGHSPLHEFAFLLAHGMLHLIGFDDQTEAGYQRMVALQQAALLQAGIV
jgi:probable rRNA maturation factor